MSDKQSEQAEPRKIVAGDRVQLKGGEGPKMTVNRRHSQDEIVCVWWDKNEGIFEQESFHGDALQLVEQSDSCEELTVIGQANDRGYVERLHTDLLPGELIYVKRVEVKR